MKILMGDYSGVVSGTWPSKSSLTHVCVFHNVRLHENKAMDLVLLLGFPLALTKAPARAQSPIVKVERFHTEAHTGVQAVGVG